MFCGIDAHKRFHVAALVNQGGRPCGALSFANSPEGTARLRAFLAEHEAERAPIGVEGAGHFARAMCAQLAGLGHRVLDVPPWRTRRDRRTTGPGKTDATDALVIAQVVRIEGERLGPALEPELVRTIRLLELARRQAVRDRTQLIQRLRSLWLQIDPTGEDALVACQRKKALAQLRRIDLGPDRPARITACLIGQMADDIERLNGRINDIEREVGELLDRHGNPVAGLHGAGATIASALIAHAHPRNQQAACSLAPL